MNKIFQCLEQIQPHGPSCHNSEVAKPRRGAGSNIKSKKYQQNRKNLRARPESLSTLIIIYH